MPGPVAPDRRFSGCLAQEPDGCVTEKSGLRQACFLISDDAAVTPSRLFLLTFLCNAGDRIVAGLEGVAGEYEDAAA
jgi:hypothetical protein